MSGGGGGGSGAAQLTQSSPSNRDSPAHQQQEVNTILALML